jgi:hypothetical protein
MLLSREISNCNNRGALACNIKEEDVSEEGNAIRVRAKRQMSKYIS